MGSDFFESLRTVYDRKPQGAQSLSGKGIQRSRVNPVAWGRSAAAGVALALAYPSTGFAVGAPDYVSVEVEESHSVSLHRGEAGQLNAVGLDPPPGPLDSVLSLREVPPDLAALVEAATDGATKREELDSDAWVNSVLESFVKTAE